MERGHSCPYGFEWSADTPVRMVAASAAKKSFDDTTHEAAEKRSLADKSVRAPALHLEQDRAYKHFIIDLYHAKPLNGYTWLHGAEAERSFVTDA